MTSEPTGWIGHKGCELQSQRLDALEGSSRIAAPSTAPDNGGQARLARCGAR